MAIEEPDFKIESKTDHYEIRKYGPVTVAETKIESDFENAGSQAFRILANYIFGGNKTKTKIEMTAPVTQIAESEKIKMTAPVTQIDGSEKIDMTAPVTQSKSEAGFLVQFTMPKKFSLNTLPIPNDQRVQLREIPSRKIAVYTYSGSWSESRYQEKLLDFMNILKNDNVKTIGEPVLARFNSPFQLWFLRRNEIWLEISDLSSKK